MSVGRKYVTIRVEKGGQSRMPNVRKAAFRRIAEAGDLRLAEVEVQTDGPGAPSLLAYFRDGPKGYQLVRVLKNDAQTEVDWYDNSEHTAFEDVTMKLFSGPSHTSGDDRQAFAGQVLEMEGVREELDAHFGRGGR